MNDSAADANGPDFSRTFTPVAPYPYEETHDLRKGPELHRDLLPLLPLVGCWRGRGQGGYPSIEGDFHYAQEARFSHDGRPFLYYESRSWLLDEEDRPVRPAAREVGFWRPAPSSEKSKHGVELELCHPTGIMQLYYGQVDGVQIEIATDAVVRSPEAKEVKAEKRLYGIVDGALMYAAEMAYGEHPLTPHLSARLERVDG